MIRSLLLSAALISLPAGALVEAPVTAARPEPARVVPLPVGYYIDSRIGTCAKPFADMTIYLAGDRIVMPHNSCKFTSLKMIDGQNFRQTENCPDEDGRPSPASTDYRITGPQSFETTRFGDSWTYCSAAQLPAKARFYKETK